MRPARIAAASIASWKRSDSCARADRRPSLAVTWAGMSRHQMTVSSGSFRCLHEPCQRGHEVAVPGAPLDVLETEALGCRLGTRAKVLVVRLREVEQALVVAEVLREQLRVPVEPEPSDHDRVEVPGEEVGE